MSQTYNFYVKWKLIIISIHLKTFKLSLMYYDIIITQNMQILSLGLYLFSIIKSKFFCWFYLFFLNVKCVESASQKKYYWCNVISIACWYRYRIHVNHFPLLKIMIIDSTCIRVKDLDLYIIETAFKFTKV